jgi:hypothetical protein
MAVWEDLCTVRNSSVTAGQWGRLYVREQMAEQCVVVFKRYMWKIKQRNNDSVLKRCCEGRQVFCSAHQHLLHPWQSPDCIPIVGSVKPLVLNDKRFNHTKVWCTFMFIDLQATSCVSSTYTYYKVTLKFPTLNSNLESCRSKQALSAILTYYCRCRTSEPLPPFPTPFPCFFPSYLLLTRHF